MVIGESGVNTEKDQIKWLCDDDLTKGVIIIYRYTCEGTTCQLKVDLFLIGRSSGTDCRAAGVLVGSLRVSV
ncbi:hypothetical protein L2E82_08282 [Cichorium intybus]|uniref:Uncharacterized protein n=1 Tax=Cichorium intybus TaxID=13427 RepID=A0ACB9G763_CICIN|nr:hypothetical protein L2E82_08282 [Cichorium intybus]